MLKTKDGKSIALDQIRAALEKFNGAAAPAARELGISPKRMRGLKKQLLQLQTPPQPSPLPSGASEKPPVKNDFAPLSSPPSPEIDIEALIQREISASERVLRHAEASKLVKLQIKLDGPVGIMHIGDPHIDDKGRDMRKIKSHVDLLRKTEGLYAGGLGDFHNNWVGRLARLYADQNVTKKEAWMLIEWFISSIDWLYIVEGNHDLFSGDPNPMDFVVRHAKVGYYAPHGARIELSLPSGKKVTINARHDFKGNSQWNPAHGVMKAAQLGWRDHIVVCGHKHTSSHNLLKDPMSGRITHALQVASYKTVDEYAKELGCLDQNMFCAPLTIINPTYNEDDVRFIRFEPEPEEGADILSYMRRKWARSAVCSM